LNFTTYFQLSTLNFELSATLALASAALYGAADFLGGMGARRTSTMAVVSVSQCAGMVLLGLALVLLPHAEPSTNDLIWGGVAGLAGGIGVALLYRALAVGRMAVVAPTTAVCAVAIPVTAAMLLGERPSIGRLTGIGLAVVAIVLVSRQRLPRGEDGRRQRAGRHLPPGLGLALISGVAIGFFFLALARTAATAGLWPLLAARVVSVGFFAAAAVVSGRSLRMAAPVAAIVVAAGVVDMLANALYLIATRYGPLSTVVTLSSLYPASTVILARVVLGERLSAWQGAGIVCALVAVVLIVSG
jgi:drug/metabolite transporter (DMT)-like permease